MSVVENYHSDFCLRDAKLPYDICDCGAFGNFPRCGGKASDSKCCEQLYGDLHRMSHKEEGDVGADGVRPFWTHAMRPYIIYE